ncbi:NUDIX domain-containing protein [Streptomyces sp. DH10]|uniref:NUDIX domain-containing protein n=1 Tax=Streptomyces sp. DH10 TaxID=3040121 RepID=UPI003FA6EA67
MQRAPGHPVTATVLITDQHDRLLIVHPARGGKAWHLPGGLVEEQESPLDAARRETREEIGLDLDIRDFDFFAAEWIEASRPGRRNRLAFVFAGPVLTEEDTSRITLQSEELDSWRWATREEARSLLHPAIVARIVGPLQTPMGAVYRETRREGTP